MSEDIRKRESHIVDNDGLVIVPGDPICRSQEEINGQEWKEIPPLAPAFSRYSISKILECFHSILTDVFE